MAFNFGGFLAGMSETIVSSIEEEEAQQRRFDLLAETDAMKQRNARKAERDKKQAVLEESAKYLESLGYDEDSIAHIAKQGTLAIDDAITYGRLAREKGMDINTIYKLEGVRDPSDTKEIVVGPQQATVTTGVGAVSDFTGFDRDKLQDLLAPDLKDKFQSSLDAAYAVESQKALFAKTPEERDAAEQRANRLLQRMKSTEGAEEGRLFSEGTIGTEVARARKEARTALDFATGKEGEIIGGELAAAKSLYAFNYNADTKQPMDALMSNNITAMQRGAQSKLRQYGSRMANGNFNSPLEAKKLKGVQTESVKQADGSMKTQVTSYKPLSLEAAMQGAKQGQFKVGDVVLVNEKQQDGSFVTKVQVYTGLEKYSANHDLFFNAATLNLQ
jgi:hypothetical protein